MRRPEPEGEALRGGSLRSIDPVPRSRDRLLTFSDGSTLRLHGEALQTIAVEAEDVVPPQRLQALRLEDERVRAREAALRLLAARSRSREEMRRALVQRGLSSAVAAEIIERLVGAGLLDDAAFAHRFVEQRAVRPRSRRLLLQELAGRGVRGDTALTAVEAVDDEVAAEAAARTRLPGLQGLPYETFYRRLGSFLQRRGFGYEAARAVVQRLWRELQQEREPEMDS